MTGELLGRYKVTRGSGSMGQNVNAWFLYSLRLMLRDTVSAGGEVPLRTEAHIARKQRLEVHFDRYIGASQQQLDDLQAFETRLAMLLCCEDCRS